MMTLEQMRDDYDWKQAFGYAEGTADVVGEPEFSTGVKVPNTGFTFDDVDEVLAYEEGERDGEPWICVVKLKDGRFGFLTAGCDYTGWDCHAGGSASVAGSYEDLIRFGLGDADRARLFPPPKPAEPEYDEDGEIVRRPKLATLQLEKPK